MGLTQNSMTVSAGRRQKRCLFCGCTLRSKKAKAGGKSDEHIIPQWLINHLGIRQMVITPMLNESASGRILDLRRHVLPAFKAGMVCAQCNTGWMTQLEASVKPILISLIADPYRLPTLTAEDRNIIARWTFKTAAVLNRVSTYGNPGNEIGHPVPDDHLSAIMNGEMPSGVAVVGGGYAASKLFDWLQYATWLIGFSRIPLQPGDGDRSYKIALSFRDLLLAVVYYPSQEYCYGVAQGQYSPLWEGDRRIVQVPPPLDPLPIRSNSPALEGFLRNIMLLSKTWLELVGNWANTRLILEP